MKKMIVSIFLAIIMLISVCITMTAGKSADKADYIRYAEFNVTCPALEKAMNADISSCNEEIKLNWIDLLSYLGAKYGGDFSRYREADMDNLIKELESGKQMDELTEKMQYYSYYHDVYSAVLGGFLGKLSDVGNNNSASSASTEPDYGLKVYSPVASGFAYSHYDDFGASRSYGYARNHLGHDLMCAVGTPIIAVEDGVVEAMGWNQYGGWRIGIRSMDRKRYYYYAHLRKNRPYHCDLKEGSFVRAGSVIGYAGRTGYSARENTNNIETPHLHFGIELIFDESQKECDNEIWIDLYAITALLEKHKADVIRIPETKEYYSSIQLSTQSDKELSSVQTE